MCLLDPGVAPGVGPGVGPGSGPGSGPGVGPGSGPGSGPTTGGGGPSVGGPAVGGPAVGTPEGPFAPFSPSGPTAGGPTIVTNADKTCCGGVYNAAAGGCKYLLIIFFIFVFILEQLFARRCSKN